MLQSEIWRVHEMLDETTRSCNEDIASGNTKPLSCIPKKLLYDFLRRKWGRIVNQAPRSPASKRSDRQLCQHEDQRCCKALRKPSEPDITIRNEFGCKQTWRARSLDGRSTTALNLLTTRVIRDWTRGIAYARVFPLPVGAQTQTSRMVAQQLCPSGFIRKSVGITALWTGNKCCTFIFFNASSKSEFSPL